MWLRVYVCVCVFVRVHFWMHSLHMLDVYRKVRGAYLYSKKMS